MDDVVVDGVMLKPGQVWRSHGADVYLEHNFGDLIGTTKGWVVARGAASVARWLSERGYKHVGSGALSPVDRVMVAETAPPVAASHPLHGAVVKLGDVYAKLDLQPSRFPMAQPAMGPAFRVSDEDFRRIADGSIKPVEPDLGPLRALLGVVAEINTSTSRAQSRHYVDMAMQCLRGEPFSKAILATLVVISDVIDMAPTDIVAAIDACRVWELTRTIVAPGRRTLLTNQEIACVAAVYDALEAHGAAWGELTRISVSGVYERARSSC